MPTLTLRKLNFSRLQYSEFGANVLIALTNFQCSVEFTLSFTFLRCDKKDVRV